MKINRNDWEDYDPYDDEEEFVRKFPLKEEGQTIKKKHELIRKSRKVKAKEREKTANADNA